MILKIIFATLLISFSVEGARILITFPTISKSHVLPLQVIAKELAKRNHEVTFVSAFPLSKPMKNYRDIIIPFDEKDKNSFTESVTKPGGPSPLDMMQNMPKLIYGTGNATLQMDAMKKLMNEEQFDLLIVGYFMTEFMLGLGDHFKCPTIMFSPAGTFSPLSSMVGNPLSPSGARHFMFQSIDLTNFVGRLKNFIVNIFDVLIFKQLTKWYGKHIYNINFPQDRYRSYEESMRNVSLVLVNIHFSAVGPRPYLPNLVEVGGLQVKSKADPLPEDLKKFLDDAKDGAIIFSLGSNAKSEYLPEKAIKTLLQTFSQIKQRVVMKWESDRLEGKPDNVFISKWLPQDDILAHKNIKLFISHCGYGGLIEAKYHGVPILGSPLFGDQPANAITIENEGWGRKIDIQTITTEELKKEINELITNPRYANTVKSLSALARDRPMSAQDTAIYWIEYVIRHHGAPHLHYASADLNFFQDNSFDVIALILGTIYIVFKIIAFVCKKLCCGKRKSAIKQKKN